MSLEDSYDAWVRGLMGGGKYAANEQQAEAASDAVQQMQAQLEALSAAQKRQSAASSALGAVQKAGAATAENVRKIALHNVEITGYEGERLQLTHVDRYEED